MLIIGGAAVGKVVYDKYSYSKERVNPDEFYQVSGEESAIILQDERVEEKAIIKDGICYFDLDTVHKYLNEIFYVDLSENLLLYTTAVENIRVNLGGTVYSTSKGETDAGYVIAYTEGEKVYVAADFVKQYTNFSYDMYDRHIQVYTEWGVRMTAQINKKTAVREKGGIKSPILRDMEAGESVEILEQMDTWSKVKTSDSIIGYVENKRLSEGEEQQETPVTDYTAPEYTSLLMNKKVNMGFHAIGAVVGNSTLEDMVAESRGMNVISPTWFSLNDNEGNFRNFGTKDYVDRAHAKGLQVWGALDNFNYKNETGEAIDTLTVLSSTTKRQNLVNQISNTALELGMDGINIDFEGLEEACGIHYVQFLRELSVQCRINGLVLSVDNYVPFHFNNYYRLDVQGEILDYVVIMGYDEHWHGSKDPGSVASIEYVSGGLDKTLEQVPAEKVINALPFYTIEWRVEGANVTDKYLTLNNTAEYLKRIGVEKVWDETTCQNYVEWKDGSATYQVWVEDEQSISVKLNVMKARNIGGVAVWRLGYGTETAWELLNIYANS
ncbi:MAG: glycosyl hydrolase family 18 protein [Bacteroidales bacterium]|nr:glycosyl hydrolase family 18 protein [Lachnoclostridium sp.]MCM1383833.1 glycosyl hydrolase family 18 protein [Lachnoclostridium sp.]MCM1464514.1 glycosyl hydrolase family 18 protein [Bacteroidales bacterium]